MAATVTWVPPTGGLPVSFYTVTSTPDGRTAVVAGGLHTAVVDGLRPGVAYRFVVAATDTDGTGPVSSSSPAVTPTSPGLRLRTLTAARILAPQRVTNGHPLVVKVAGHGGVPHAGAAAVVFNVHVQRTAVGTVNVSPGPSSAGLTLPSSQTSSSMAVVGLGRHGTVVVRDSGAPATVTLDVTGWQPAADGSGPADLLTPVTGGSVLARTRMRAGTGRTLDIAGRAGVPAKGAAAALLQVQVTGASRAGSVAVYPAGGKAPSGAAVRYAAGTPVVTQTLAPLDAAGRVRVLNETGTAKVSISVLGWVSSASGDGGSFLRTVKPDRLATLTSLTAGTPRLVTVAAHGGVPGAGASIRPVAALLTVVAQRPSRSGTLTLAGRSGPAMTLTGHRTSSSTVVAPLDDHGQVSVAVTAGHVHVTVTVLGYLAGDDIVDVHARSSDRRHDGHHHRRDSRQRHLRRPDHRPGQDADRGRHHGRRHQ